METTRQHLESQQAGGTDFQRLQEHTMASADELREFIGGLKGRNPQEVMGAAAQSSLLRSIVLATFATAVILLLLTAGPYMLKGRSASVEQPAAAPANNEVANTPDKEPQPAEANPAAAPATDVATPASDKPDAAKAAKAMGIDGSAKPDAQPTELDNKLDKLLDGL